MLLQLLQRNLTQSKTRNDSNGLLPAEALVPPQVAGREHRLPRAFAAMFLIDVIFGCAYLLSYYVFHRLMPQSMSVQAGGDTARFSFHWLASVFDLNSEMNVPTWWSSAQLMVVGVGLGLFAWVKFDRRERMASWGLIALAAIFATLSLDEVACIHENVGGKLVHWMKSAHYGGGVTLLAFWVAVCGPFLVVMSMIGRATWVHWKRHPKPAIKFAAGLALFVVMAVGMELFWIATFGGDPSNSPIEVLIEELGEMLGVTLMASATFDLLRQSGLTLTVTQPEEQPAASTMPWRRAGTTVQTGYR